MSKYNSRVSSRSIGIILDITGRMIRAWVFTQTTEFAYNGLGARLVVSVDGYGTTLYTLDYAAGNRILAETTPTETVSYLYGRDCLGEQRDDEWLYYLHDAEGYVRQGADITGDVVSAWLFDPDGTVLEGPHGPVSHLICGGVYDWSTGLIYQGGRYFDPNLGIWLALMPLMVVQGWRKRKDKRQWVLLLCMGLFVVGSLAGCGKQEPTTTIIPTCTPTLSPEDKIFAEIWEEVGNSDNENGDTTPPDSPDCPSCDALPRSGAELPYDPGAWNSDRNIKTTNNCYSYAAHDLRTHENAYDALPTPGVASGMGLLTFPLSADDIRGRAQLDGFSLKSDCETMCPPDRYKVMGFLSMVEGGQFHFYRQDADGCWSHKPGASDVTDLDPSGNKIGDPRSPCTSKAYPPHNYDQFFGCFCVKPGTQTEAPVL